jgi:hypothetical protein
LICEYPLAINNKSPASNSLRFLPFITYVSDLMIHYRSAKTIRIVS